MILPDVTVLVRAFRQESPGHEQYATWLSRLVAGGDELGLHDVVLAGALRIVTNPRIYRDPAPAGAAREFLARVRSARRARWLSSGPATWTAFDGLAAADPGVRGNLVPDALLAALALAHRCRLATADRGFARFPGLTWFDPADSDA